LDRLAADSQSTTRRVGSAFKRSRTEGATLALRKSQIYRWLLARAMRRQARKSATGDAQAERRRWNFPTRSRRRASDT